MSRHALSEIEIISFRESLCAAAAGLFAARGYSGVTMRALAAEVGCSPMTPYRYFRDKQSIFAAVRADAYRRFADAQEEALEQGGNALGRLASLGLAYLHFAAEQPDAYRLMFELAQPDPKGFPELQAAEARAWAPLRDIVREGVQDGLLEGDPDTVAHIFWAGVHGIASLHIAGKLVQGRSLEDLIPETLATLVRGNRHPTETAQ